MAYLKLVIRKILPKKLFLILLAVINYLVDLNLFLKWSVASVGTKDKVHLRYLMTVAYHKIEKALALKAPRPGFGKEVAKELVNYLHIYVNRYGTDDFVMICLSVLNEFLNFDKQYALLDDVLKNQIQTLLNLNKEPFLAGGTKVIEREDLFNAMNFDFKKFSNTRYSVRDFSSDPVEYALLEEAVLIAQKSPSVCNRQTTKVHIYADKEVILGLLKHQNGNAGFTQLVDKLIIVTADLKGFISVGERNQCWIDGGMFSMSLVYALHSLRLGTCCLNLSLINTVSKRLKIDAQIPENEVLIMMIAVGNFPKSFKVAFSKRSPLQDILKRH